MRIGAFVLVLATLVAIPSQAQECRENPAAVRADFFPDSIGELVGKFYGMRDGCTAYLYEAAEQDPQHPIPWVQVKIEAHDDPLLGSSAAGLESYWQQAGLRTHRVQDWPVAYIGASTGHEWVTFLGSLRLTVIVKNLAPMASRLGLADRVFAIMMTRIPPPCT